MKLNYILFFLLYSSSYVIAQVPRGEELVGLHTVSTSELNNVASPIVGTVLYNPTDEKLYVYAANGWKAMEGVLSDLVFDGTTGILQLTLPETPGNQVDLSTYYGAFLNTNTQSSQHTIATHTANGVTTNIKETVSQLNLNTQTGTLTHTNEENETATAKLLSANADNGATLGTDAGLFKSINKSYVQNFPTTKTFTNANAQLLNVFPEITIQPYKKVYLKFYIPTRSDADTWGGLYVNINVKINGTWYNLGNTGHDGGAMARNARKIHALNHEMLLDPITVLGLPANQSYTLQIELTARSYDGTTIVNGSHDINRTANNLNYRGGLQTWASDQNYCHIIILEKDL